MEVRFDRNRLLARSYILELEYWYAREPLSAYEFIAQVPTTKYIEALELAVEALENRIKNESISSL